MKSFLLAAFAALLLVSCSRSSYPTSPQPVPGDPRYPDQNRNPYPNNNPYPTDNNNYPGEGQRDGVVTIIRTGNANYEHLPPGQAKKKYGGKSARVYAPGQQKKNGGYNTGIATVISVPDMYASRANSGQLYYVYRGNTYWKQNDGYYYLQGNDQYGRNNDGWKNGKGKGKYKHKERDDDEDDD